MKQDQAMQKLLDFYLSLPQGASSNEGADANQLQAASAGGDTCMDCNTASINLVDTTCQTAGCKRKRTKECVTGMCFQCCFNLKTACSAHFRMRKKREEEDRYIEEGMRSSSRQKTSFYHYEEKFMKCNQTVVIWCLQDFLRRKEWSADTMAQYKREMRTQELLRRRHSLNSQATDPSRASSSSLVTSATSNNGHSRGNASKAGGSSTAAASPAPSASVKSEGSATKGRGRPAKSVTNCAESSAASTSGTPSKGAVSKGVQSKAAGSKRGRNGKVGAIHFTSAPLTKAAKRFQKVKEMWQRKYKLSSL